MKPVPVLWPTEDAVYPLSIVNKIDLDHPNAATIERRRKVSINNGRQKLDLPEALKLFRSYVKDLYVQGQPESLDKSFFVDQQQMLEELAKKLAKGQATDAEKEFVDGLRRWEGLEKYLRIGK